MALLYALFGWALFGWTFHFSIEGEFSGNIEISLLLSHDEVIQDSESLLVWQVIKLGRSKHNVQASCPVVWGTDGQTKFGFGTVKDKSETGCNWFETVNSIAAPAKWDGSKFKPIEMNNKLILQLDPEGTVGHGFVIGTHDGSLFRPYHHLRNIDGKPEVSADPNLYLHAIETNGYRPGQYGEQLVERFRDNHLMDGGKGIKLTDLKPLSHWQLSQSSGRLRLYLADSQVNQQVETSTFHALPLQWMFNPASVHN
ncbi:hypothetical protein DXG01_000720 [Tephrocybe rancida]|nr:hypothetical protein DXG01_000720 [Tephrocybe rancida]